MHAVWHLLEVIQEPRSKERSMGKTSKNPVLVLMHGAMCMFFGLVVMAGSLHAAPLSPDGLHPLAEWNGSDAADGLLHESDMASLFDGNPSSVWRSWDTSSWRPCPSLTSPVPFVVESVTVTAPSSSPERAAGAIQVMPVGSAQYEDTGLSVPGTLTAGETWTGSMPAGYQVPISGIRHNGGFHVSMGELQFDGYAVGDGGLRTITNRGTVASAPGSENGSGTLTDGLLKHSTAGYHTGNSEDHRIVIDFGNTVHDVAYAAINPNQYWKMYDIDAVGTNGPLDSMILTCSAHPRPTRPTRRWVDRTTRGMRGLLFLSGTLPVHL
jgi:hypothetical protein